MTINTKEIREATGVYVYPADLQFKLVEAENIILKLCDHIDELEAKLKVAESSVDNFKNARDKLQTEFNAIEEETSMQKDHVRYLENKLKVAGEVLEFYTDLKQTLNPRPAKEALSKIRGESWMNEVKFSKVLDETTWDLTNFVCKFASEHDALLAEELFNKILQENEELKSGMVVERYHKIALLKCEIHELKAQLNDLMQKLSINEQDRRNLQSELDKTKSELLNKTQRLESCRIETNLENKCTS